MLRRLAIAGVLIILCASVFGQTVRFGFINYDDDSYVIDNPEVVRGITISGAVWALTHVHSNNWHPLTTLSHMADCQLFGLAPWGPHFVNVLLHTTAAVLCFFAFYSLTRELWKSAFVASVFAIHPLHVESVAWIAERKDVLSGVFFMLTLILYSVSIRRSSRFFRVAVPFAFAVGLLSKPMLVTLPLVLILLDYWPLRRFSQNRAVRLAAEKIPLFILSAASCVATLLAQRNALGSTTLLPISLRLENAVVAYIEYVRQTVWPSGLAVFYPHPLNRLGAFEVVIAFALLLTMTVAVIAARRDRPYLLVGWIWYLIMLVPVIGIVQVGSQGHADRYTYLPQIGLVVMATWGLADLLQPLQWSAWIGRLAMTSIILSLSICAHGQVMYWGSSERLWRRCIDVVPNNDVAHAHLARAFAESGKAQSLVISEYEKAIEIRPKNPDTHNSFATYLVSIDHFDGAISEWRTSLQVEPANNQTRNNLATALLHIGSVHEALDLWLETLHRDSRNITALNARAWVLSTYPDSSVRNGAEAITSALEAAALRPDDVQVLRTLSAALAESGRFNEAITAATRALFAAEWAGDKQIAQEIRRNISLYQQEVPLRSRQ